MGVAAVLAAAGAGSRMGRRKQLLELLGKPVAAWSLEVLAHSPEVSEIVIACEDDERARFAEVAGRHGGGKVARIVAGGARRQDSVYAALGALAPETEVVLVHDGARPFLTQDLLKRVIKAVRVSGAAVVAVPAVDTMKQVGETGTVLRTIPREQLWAAQTPQAFARNVIMRAFESAYAESFVGTDCSMLVERYGLAPVIIVEGSYDNLKITMPEDLAVAERIALRRAAASAS